MSLLPHPAMTGVAALLLESSAHRLMHFLTHFGYVGLFLVSIVDSSFVPLPIPGVTDIMVVLYAAGHANLLLLLGITTLGSALGGLITHKVGQTGGEQFLAKHVPARILHRITGWMEHHALLSVALPAILPPPMPLSPFVLAAGCAHMSRRRFMLIFTISRFLRHAAFAALGVLYGQQVLAVWKHFSARWGATLLTVFWVVTLLFALLGIWRLVQTSRTVSLGPNRPAA
ncbi:MAG: membrane-associated protein [Acidobacteriaceae bacterium]|nr:membrane-associated protein [Acidobacteriaceae bacterium]